MPYLQQENRMCVFGMLDNGAARRNVARFCMHLSTIYSFVNHFPSTCSTRDRPCPSQRWLSNTVTTYCVTYVIALKWQNRRPGRGVMFRKGTQVPIKRGVD